MARSRSLAELIEQNRSSAFQAGQTIGAGFAQAESSPQGGGVQSAPGGGGGLTQTLETAGQIAALAEAGSAGAAAAGAAGAGAAAGGAAAGAAGAGAASGAAGAAGAAEGIGGLLALFCWVAAEYYPRGSESWFRCRDWVLAHPRITHWYEKHGRTFASFLRTHPVCRFLFWPIVLWARWNSGAGERSEPSVRGHESGEPSVGGSVRGLRF